MILTVSHSLISSHLLPHLLKSLEIMTSSDLDFLYKESLETVMPYFRWTDTHLSVVIDDNPGINVEYDHCNNGEYCKAMVDIPVHNQAVEGLSLLCVGAVELKILLSNIDMMQHNAQKSFDFTLSRSM